MADKQNEPEIAFVHVSVRDVAFGVPSPNTRTHSTHTHTRIHTHANAPASRLCTREQVKVCELHAKKRKRTCCAQARYAGIRCRVQTSVNIEKKRENTAASAYTQTTSGFCSYSHWVTIATHTHLHFIECVRVHSLRSCRCVCSVPCMCLCNRISAEFAFRCCSPATYHALTCDAGGRKRQRQRLSVF